MLVAYFKITTKKIIAEMVYTKVLVMFNVFLNKKYSFINTISKIKIVIIIKEITKFLCECRKCL
jgi:hypothetical protein